MKNLILYLFLITYSLPLFAQQDSGFTNKAEAKNLMVNGKKEGKWVEYVDFRSNVTEDTNHCYAYRLTIYQADEPTGLVRCYYYKSGKFWCEIPYVNGKKDGVSKGYYESGKLAWISPHTDGSKNGTEKIYYESGVLRAIIPYTNGQKQGDEKHYYESGKLKSETTYEGGMQIKIINYNENGKEIKK